MAAKRRRKAEGAALEQGLAALQTDDRHDIVQQQQNQQRLMQIETIGCESGSELSHSAELIVYYSSVLRMIFQ